MINYIASWFDHLETSEGLVLNISIILLLLFMGLFCIIGMKLTNRLVIFSFTKFKGLNKLKWNEAFLKRKVYDRMSHIVPVIIIYAFAPLFPQYLTIILQNIATIYFIVVVVSVISCLLNVVDDIYNTFEYSKYRPIKGFLQVIKIIVYVIAGLQIIAALMGKDPLLLLSGVGAFSAVLMLVFQDSILGLVASIQLSANDMMRIGDWVEMPSYNVDGEVLEISLNIVKIENFDRTVNTVPTYAFMTNSFKNWRGMTEAGGRRIKRSIYIDISSIKFCTKEMLEAFKKIDYLTDYIETKQEEIRTYNEAHNVDYDDVANGRHLTNIGVFRIYIHQYLKYHPKIHKGMTQIVRQLSPVEFGLPIEIYAFTREIVWDQYEGIQSDIFDHILAIIPKFGLRIYQRPSWYDFRNEESQHEKYDRNFIKGTIIGGESAISEEDLKD